MELQALIEEFRSQIDDEAPPYLVSDDAALLYAIDAQDMFVRLTRGIADVTVPAADDPGSLRLHDLEFTAGDVYTAFSPYILRTRTATLLTAKRDVQIDNEADIPKRFIRDYGLQIQSIALDDTETGDVTCGVLGVRDGYVRWYKVPTDADTVRLHVLRLPYPRIASQEDALEIQEQHHLHLVKWMKHLAYSKQDAEIYDKKQADANEASFKSYCDQARQEIERQRYKPRVVQYGGL